MKGGILPAFDLYQELEVDSAASPETIEAAWRSLVKRYHPDANPSLGSDRIQRLNEAHDWLINPVERARYDLLRQRPAGGEPYAESAASRRTAAAGSGQPTRSRSRATPWAWAKYAVGCLGSVIAAYVVSVIFVLILDATNLTAIVMTLIGEEGAVALIQLAGNVLFATSLGYLVAATFIVVFNGPREDGTLVVVGTVTALAVTFGFPSFATSYLSGLTGWMVTDGAGLPAIAAISAIEAAAVGLVVAGTGWLRRSQ